VRDSSRISPTADARQRTGSAPFRRRQSRSVAWSARRPQARRLSSPTHVTRNFADRSGSDKKMQADVVGDRAVQLTFVFRAGQASGSLKARENVVLERAPRSDRRTLCNLTNFRVAARDGGRRHGERDGINRRSLTSPKVTAPQHRRPRDINSRIAYPPNVVVLKVAETNRKAGSSGDCRLPQPTNHHASATLDIRSTCPAIFSCGAWTRQRTGRQVGGRLKRTSEEPVIAGSSGSSQRKRRSAREDIKR